MIYVIHAKGTDFYKVGIANGPKGRLACLQTGCPYELTLIAFGDWPNAEELKIHRFLTKRGHHIRAEWFKWSEDLNRLIDCLEADDLDQWHAHQLSTAPKRLVRALAAVA